MNTRFTSQFKGDKWIWSIVVILSLIGILAVYSSTGALAYSEQKGDTEWYFLRHTRFLLIGLVLLYITHHIPFQYYARISQIFLLISIGLLFSTLFIGTELNNATRVLPIPLLGITFQPSDMAKLFLVMYIARYLSKNQAEIDSPRVFWTTLKYILVVVLLIAPENLSTALVVFLTCSLLMFIGRVNVTYLLFLLFSGLGLLSFFVVVLLNINTANLKNTRIPTWKQRIETFTGRDKGEGEGNYQQLQSKIAVSSGGILGKGPGNSTQRNYLPHSYSDFIYAIIIEEYGLLGGLLVMGCFLVLIFRCLKIVVESPRAFGALVAIGLGLSMGLQAFVNMGVAVGLLPVTGLTIPMVSMGGTSIFMNSIAFGIILGISKYAEEEKQKEKEGVLAGI